MTLHPTLGRAGLQTKEGHSRQGEEAPGGKVCTACSWASHWHESAAAGKTWATSLFLCLIPCKHQESWWDFSGLGHSPCKAPKTTQHIRRDWCPAGWTPAGCSPHSPPRNKDLPALPPGPSARSFHWVPAVAPESCSLQRSHQRILSSAIQSLFSWSYFQHLELPRPLVYLDPLSFSPPLSCHLR